MAAAVLAGKLGLGSHELQDLVPVGSLTVKEVSSIHQFCVVLWDTGPESFV